MGGTYRRGKDKGRVFNRDRTRLPGRQAGRIEQTSKQLACSWNPRGRVLEAVRLFAFFVFAGCASAQTLSFGVEGGIPLQAGFTPGGNGPVLYYPILRRYSVGPVGEVALPKHFRVEAGALYHRVGWDSIGLGMLGSSPFRSTVRIGSWDFAALVKRPLRSGTLRPFAAAGPSVRRFFTTRQIYEFSWGTISKQMVEQLSHKNVPGIAAAFGVEIGRTVRAAFQIRYTRWLRSSVYPAFGVGSQSNQWDVLLAFTLGVH
jgi:hypothetical protein